MHLSAIWSGFRTFVAPFHDPRAWTFILICAGVVFLIDPVMVKTVLVWVLQAGAFCGLVVIASRFMFPQISLSEHVEQARVGNVASGLVVLAVCLVVAALLIMFAVWGKA